VRSFLTRPFIGRRACSLGIASLLSLSCSGPTSNTSITFNFPMTTVGTISVREQPPKPDTFTQYDVGRMSLYVTVESFSGPLTDENDRRRVLKKWVDDEYFGSSPRNYSIVKDITVNSMIGVEIPEGLGQSRQPSSLLRALVGTNHLVVMWVLGRESGLSLDDFAEFLQSTNPRETD
jgi:hypothetical protein